MMRRRNFVALAASAAAPSSARTLTTIGAQLYTVRAVLPERPFETLSALERIGYREAEVVGASLGQIWASLKKTSLKPVSLHLDTALFTREQAKLPPALDDARRRGFEYVICPYIAPQDRGGADVIRKLGESLNRAGELCRQAGLRLCYHNHAFEFEPVEGGTLLDVLMRTTDPKLVALELDIMWAQVAGVDPAGLLKRYAGRVPILHLKDLAPGIEPRYNEKVPREAFREVGHGVIDIPGVLRAAAGAQVKHYFVEQDQTPGDPIESLRKSHEYLTKLTY